MDYNYTTTYTSNTTDPAVAGAMLGFMMIMMVIYLAIFVIMAVSMWKLFTKAGKPGWAAIVPFYNIIVELEIIGRPLWWIALLLIPFANFVVAIWVMYEFVRSYGKDTGYAVLTILFPIIMFPIMAFGKSTRYVGPVAATVPTYAPQPQAPLAQQPMAPVQPAPYTAPTQPETPPTPSQNDQQ